uniref:Ig-like domain-containing protein n=1 Tax=Labrus bergylta TaxID=56723 RepID=A0A3Q3GF77_9LABR
MFGIHRETFSDVSSVGETPALKEEIQDVTTKLGESGTLTCGIIGRPLPEIKWYRYGKELIQSRKYKMSSDGRNHSLSILSDEQEDEGLYTCRAINEAGEVETSGKLRLQAAPQLHPGFPLKEKYYAGAGTSLRLHVVYIGRPIPKIMWFYGKKPLNSSENVIIENTEIQRKDSGYYSITAKNRFGMDKQTIEVNVADIPEAPKALVVSHGLRGQTSSSGAPMDSAYGELFVESVRSIREFYISRSVKKLRRRVDKTKLLQRPPEIEALPEDISIEPGKVLTVTCAFSGDAKHIEWSRSGRIIQVTAGGRFHIDTSEDLTTLIITGVKAEDAGTYTLKLSNELGSDTATVHISIRSV